MGSLQDLMQFIFAGLTGGAIYALVALGFGVVHNTMGIVNFTQVDFVSLGGMILYSALVTAGLPMAPALLLAVAGVTLVAILVEVAGVRPSRSQSHLVLIFLTIGLSIILRGAMKIIWGKTRMAVPSLSGEAPVHLAGAAILPQTLWILALTSLAIIGLVLFFRKTSMGLAMRGVAANPEAAAVVGLKVWRVKAASFALAGALGGLAGCLVTPITTLELRRGGAPGPQGLCRRHPGRLRFLPRGHLRRPHPGPPGEPGRGVSFQRLQGRHRLHRPVAGPVHPPQGPPGRGRVGIFM